MGYRCWAAPREIKTTRSNHSSGVGRADRPTVAAHHTGRDASLRRAAWTADQHFIPLVCGLPLMKPYRASTHFLPAIVAGLLIPAVADAQGLEYVKAHYTKYEYRIPMRDGKRL
ncbi:MAG: hypothetical protein CMJ59_22835, partial [Planctomycetaceae bacterium]|nr:hypothetical protein [Planctomycetaceae bacterium]